MGSNLQKLKKEYEEQDNLGIAYPIYVTVQELICIGVIADGYSESCSFGGYGEIKPKHLCDGCSKYPCWDEGLEEEPESCENELQLGYVWIPVEFFLTSKGAKEYIKCNSHNHGKLRTYVNHFERRNFEMRGLLEELGFKI